MTTICDTCHLAHEPSTVDEFNPTNESRIRVCLSTQAAAMKTLLELIGDQGTCRGCQAPIYWVTHRNGKKAPYDSSGLNHFVSCPERAQFGKKKP
jgi:hypothetical protein